MTPATLRQLPDGDVVRLDTQLLRVGRDQTNDLCIDAPSMSRAHAEIERTPHGYVLRDRTSRNGTFLNGERISEHDHPLRDGDEVVFASAVSYRFIDPAATPLAPAIGRLIGVWIDSETGAVWVDAQPVDPPLSRRQLALLELLDQRANEIVSRQEIVDSVWSDVAAEGVTAQALDSLVKRLRARLRPLQLHGELLEVTRDRGIRLRRK